MTKIYLFNAHDKEYLCINIDRQTSTGWHRSLEKVKELSETTERPLKRHFPHAADKTVDEIKAYVKTHMRETQILDINDTPIPYEFW